MTTTVTDNNKQGRGGQQQEVLNEYHALKIQLKKGIAAMIIMIKVIYIIR